MTLTERVQMARMLLQDIEEAVADYEKVSNIKNRAAWRGDVYTVKSVTDFHELPLAHTPNAISRKIITLREQLNVLRKQLPNAGSARK